MKRLYFEITRLGRTFGFVLFACAFLFQSVRGGDTQAAADVSSVLQKLQTGDEEGKIQALLLLQADKNLSAEPAKILAAVVERLHDNSPNVRAQAVYTLGVFGRRSLPVVKSTYPLLSDKDPAVCRATLRALQAINPPSEEELPYVIQLLNVADPQLRVDALKVIADDGKAAVAPLAKALRNEDNTYWACIALGEIGPVASDAVSGLRKVVAGDKRPDVRMQAVMALGAIGTASAPAVPELKAVLEEGNPAIVPCTLYTLGSIGPAALPAEALLRKEMASSKPFEKVLAAWAVAKLDPHDQGRVRSAVPILVEGLTSKEIRVRSAAARALFDLRPGPAIIQPLLKKALEGADENTIDNLIDAVAGLGQPAVPQLVKFLESHVGARPKLALVLAKIGPAAKEAAPALGQIVATDKNSDARREALFALASIGSGAAGQTAVVSAVLKEDDERLQALAAFTLGKMGPGAAKAKSALEAQLQGKEFPALAAAWALAQIVPGDAVICQKSVPFLVKALSNPEEKIALEAAATLKRIGPPAKCGADGIKQASEKDYRPSVRKAAADALKAIEK
jgi:HEAT repeat protein